MGFFLMEFKKKKKKGVRLSTDGYQKLENKVVSVFCKILNNHIIIYIFLFVI